MSVTQALKDTWDRAWSWKAKEATYFAAGSKAPGTLPIFENSHHSMYSNDMEEQTLLTNTFNINLSQVHKSSALLLMPCHSFWRSNSHSLCKQGTVTYRPIWSNHCIRSPHSSILSLQLHNLTLYTSSDKTKSQSNHSDLNLFMHKKTKWKACGEKHLY